MSKYKLIMLRHGEGAWNKENRFCSWVDQKLNSDGLQEARNCGKQLKALNFEFDLVFTSILNRSIHTAWLILEELGQEWVPVESSWRLNERHYGALISLNREQMALNHGEEQVRLWRRSYNVTPPPIEESLWGVLGGGPWEGGPLEPPQLRCWPELCLPLEATPEPRMVTGPPCPLLHLETPVVPPPPSPPRSSCLPPSLPPAPSQSWIHTLSPKADFKLPNSGGEPPTKGVGFPEARFPSKVPLTVAGLGRSFLGSQLTPYRGQALCPSPAALCSDSVWGPESTGEGGPPGGAATRGRCCPGLSCSRPPGEDPGEPSVCGAVGDPSSSVFRGGSAFLRPLRSAARWGLPAAALVSMSRLCLFGGAGRSGWGHCKWACRGHGVPGAELREGGGGDHRAKGAAACGALRAST